MGVDRISAASNAYRSLGSKPEADVLNRGLIPQRPNFLQNDFFLHLKLVHQDRMDNRYNKSLAGNIIWLGLLCNRFTHNLIPSFPHRINPEFFFEIQTLESSRKDGINPLEVWFFGGHAFL